MEIMLNPNNGYVKNGKFDQYEALKDIGVKAAICYKQIKDNKLVSPEMVRQSESDAILINRGLNTILQDHTTPSEHQVVGLEITGIPKRLCMVLNNEKQYTADERSLRYTEVKANDYLTEREVKLYNKWLNIYEKKITEVLKDYFFNIYKNEKRATMEIHKLAQENARYIVSSDTPTTISYTVPLIQLNKIVVYMKQVIDKPSDNFEKSMIKYFKEFIDKLNGLNVLITKNSIYEVAERNAEVKDLLYSKHSDIKDYKNDDTLLWQNNKNIELSLFAKRNKFTAIDSKNEYGYNISYNNLESLACIAQEQRHRTINLEIREPSKFQCYVPEILKDDVELVKQWIKDIESIKDVYPQGQMMKVNRLMTVKNMLMYVSKERACAKAQLEISKVYVDNIINDTYENLLDKNEELANEVKPYVKKYRCAYPSYKCPAPCKQANTKRII